MKLPLLPAVAVTALFVCSCKKPAQREALTDVNDAAASMVDDARKEIEQGGLSVDSPVDNTRLIDALDKAGDASSGQDKIAFSLAKLSVTRMTELANKLNAVSGDLTGGLDYSEVETPEDIDALSEKIRNYQKVNAEVKAGFTVGFVDGLKKEAYKMGFKGRTRTDFFSAMESKYNRQLPLIEEIRDQDNALCGIILDQHSILKKYFGGWTWGGEEEGLQFEDDDAIDAYNLLLEKLEKVSDDQTATQRELIELQ